MRLVGWKILTLILIQSAAILTVALDIPVARQIIMFFYLTFVPGMVIFSVLRFRGLSATETLLFSAGLSIAFLMFIGLMMNELYPLLGVPEPLSTLPLILTINITLISLSVIGFVSKKDSSSERSKEFFNLSPISKSSPIMTKVKLFFASLLVILPAVSVLGVVIRTDSGNVIILLSLVIVISGLILLSTSFKIFNAIFTDLLPLVIVSIAMTLLYQVPLGSSYLTGFDVHLEHYVFELTKKNYLWTSILSAGLYESVYNSLPSITILPSIYSNLLGLSGISVYKILYPSILSLVPLGLYYIYRTQTGKMIAFLSSAFFMVNAFFYSPNMLSLMRQMIAELFFVLLVYSILNKKLSLFQGSILKVVFGTALIFSHYATSYFLITYVFLTWLLTSPPRTWARKSVSLVFPILFFSMAFVWYMNVSAAAAFHDLTYNIQNIFSGILEGSLFSPTARDPYVLRTFPTSLSESSTRFVHSRLQNLTQFFIILGLVKLIEKRKVMKFDREYISMCSVSLFILLMSIGLPFFNTSFKVARMYHITLIFLSPLFILGGGFLFGWLSKLKTPLFMRLNRRSLMNSSVRFKNYGVFLVSIVLIIFFLFESGFLYEIYGDFSDNIVLSENKVDKTILYNTITPAKDAYSAEWLKNHRCQANVYADETACLRVLKSYGLIPARNLVFLSKYIEMDSGTYLYLREFNVIEGVIIGRRGKAWNTSDTILQINETNKIYSNGASEIYQKP